MSCKGLKGKALENCKAKALKKAKEYASYKKRHPKMTDADTLLVNKSFSKNNQSFTDKKTRAAVALKLKQTKKKLKGNTATINLIGTANAKSRKNTSITTKGKKKLFKKRKTTTEYTSTAVFNKKELASKVTITKMSAEEKSKIKARAVAAAKKKTDAAAAIKKKAAAKKTATATAAAKKKTVAANKRKAKAAARSRRLGLNRNARD